MAVTLTESGLKKQIARLKSLPRGEERPWGTEKESGLRDELLRVLWRASESDEEAARVIDSVLDTAQFCPTPAELLHASNSIAKEAAPAWQSSREYCRRCSGSGYVMELREVEPIPGAKYQAEFSIPCPDCKRVVVKA